MMERTPFTPAEFDAVCRVLMSHHPFLSETSGHRSFERNAAIDGHPESKHVIGMARDFVAPTIHGLKQAEKTAKNLGLWHIVHNVTSGSHLHVQGIAPGPIPEWWREKYIH